MRIAIIPARGGSKRIPKKNIIPFCGNPMLSYPLNAAKDSQLFNKVHVSTDSEEISCVAEESGCPVDFIRDSALSDDYTGLLPVLKWVIDEYLNRGQMYDQICCIYPTSPFLLKEDLINAFALFEKYDGKYPLMTVTRYPVPIEWAFSRNDDGLMTALQPERLKHRSQDIEAAYYECASFFIISKLHLKNKDLFNGKVLSYEIPRERAVDIDSYDDLVYAEKLFKILQQK